MQSRVTILSLVLVTGIICVPSSKSSDNERAKCLATTKAQAALSETLDRTLREFFPSRKVEDGVSANRLKLEAKALKCRLSDDWLCIAIRQIEARRKGLFC